MRCLHETGQLIGGNQCDVPRTLASHDHGLAVINHLIQNARQVLAQTRICRFHKKLSTPLLYSIPVHPHRPTRDPAANSATISPNSFDLTSCRCGPRTIYRTCTSSPCCP